MRERSLKRILVIAYFSTVGLKWPQEITLNETFHLNAEMDAVMLKWPQESTLTETVG